MSEDWSQLCEIPAGMIQKKEDYSITDSDMDKVNKKAYLDATYQFLKTAYLREHVRLFSEEGILHMIPKNDSLKLMLDNQAKAVCVKPPYLFITINPRKDVTLEILQKHVKKLLSKKTITHFAYVYEVRKGKEGLHCHMLVHYNDKPYNFKRGVKNTFKTITDVNNPEILNFKFVAKEILSQKISYMLGNKKDDKKSGVKDSEKYRTDNNLQAIYHSEPPLEYTLDIPLVGVSKSSSSASDPESSTEVD